MARDGIWKSWEAVKKTISEKAFHWSGEHGRANQHNNVVSLPCTKNCILAQEDIF